MENYGLVDVLRTYCTDNGIEFLYGGNFYQNIEASQYEYAKDQLVMGADFNAAPSITTAGALEEIRYTGSLALGRKFEDTTESSLDESTIQKYDRRLKELSQILTSIISTIMCENELDVEGLDIRFDINRFDTNIDFVVCSITFIQ